MKTSFQITMRYKSLLVFAAAMSLLASGCQTDAPVPPTNVVIHKVAKLSADPTDKVWQSAPEFAAQLIPQDLVEPRLMKPSTEVLRVRAVSDGTKIAVRLDWDDASQNDLPGPARFFDACAIQFPARMEPTVPAPQMGEVGRPVQISYWNANWQAIVEGRPDSLKAIYPNASIDHYPFEAVSLNKNPAAKAEMEARYAPAKALGNIMSGPRESPVEDMIAEGPSTMARAPEKISQGKGIKTSTGWSVVFVRPVPEGFDGSHPGQIAFAVWRGEAQEVGARKMRTAWLPLTLENAP